MKRYPGVTGGDKLARYLKDKQQQLQGERTFTVGLHDPRIAALAATHEYGKGRVPVPSRIRRCHACCAARLARRDTRGGQGRIEAGDVSRRRGRGPAQGRSEGP